MMVPRARLLAASLVLGGLGSVASATKCGDPSEWDLVLELGPQDELQAARWPTQAWLDVDSSSHQDATGYSASLWLRSDSEEALHDGDVFRLYKLADLPKGQGQAAVGPPAPGILGLSGCSGPCPPIQATPSPTLYRIVNATDSSLAGNPVLVTGEAVLLEYRVDGQPVVVRYAVQPATEATW